MSLQWNLSNSIILEFTEKSNILKGAGGGCACMTGENKQSLPVNWADVRLDFGNEPPDSACEASLRDARRHDPDASARVTRAIIHFAGKRLEELELCIEHPPRPDLVEDEPGIFVSFEGEDPGIRELPGPVRMYRIRGQGNVSALIAVGLRGARIVRFDCH